MFKVLWGLGVLLWAVPVACFAIASLLTGRSDLVLVLLVIALGSMAGCAGGVCFAHVFDEDVFEAGVVGALAALLVVSWPAGHYILG